MRHEYETVARAGLVLQVDCPDLAMGRHIQFASLGLEEFRHMARLHVEALNHALANITPDQLRLHLCWGNDEGPHHYDVPLADVLDIVLEAAPTASPSKPPTRATHTNGSSSSWCSCRRIGPYPWGN